MSEYLRQQAIVNQDKLAELRIAIIGAGSIGSFTALALTKMGCEHLTLWDKDTVELHNVSNQFFNRDSIGIPKVVATSQECQRYTPKNVDIMYYHEFYEGQKLDNFDVVIVLTDNIEGRKAAFEASKASPKVTLYIDGRMGGELFRTFCFNPKIAELAVEYYNDYIDGVQNEELPCTARTIVYNVMMVSSVIASFVKKFVNCEAAPFQLLFNFGNYSFSKSKLE
jgi:molybdopterin/thiamine biosynthesis adenylyltransferase